MLNDVREKPDGQGIPTMHPLSLKQLMNRENLFETESGSIWRYFDDEDRKPKWKIYVEIPDLARRIKGWEGVEVGAVYYRPDGVKYADDFIIPKRLLRRILKLIGLSLQRRKPTDAELFNLHKGRAKIRANNHRPDLALGCSENKPVGASTSTKPYESTYPEESRVPDNFPPSNQKPESRQD